MTRLTVDSEEEDSDDEDEGNDSDGGEDDSSSATAAVAVPAGIHVQRVAPFCPLRLLLPLALGRAPAAASRLPAKRLLLRGVAGRCWPWLGGAGVVVAAGTTAPEGAA